MSWFSQNYEKAAIGGAAVVALGLAAVGWLKVGKVEETFNVSLSGRGNNDPSVANADLVQGAMATRAADLGPKQAEEDGRLVDFFTGIPLFVERSSPNVSIDLVTSAPVHPPIPNSWWLKYQLDPGFGDSPQRDADSDGFSNLDEFEAGTDPTDPKKYPSVIAKLMYVKDESTTFVVRPGFESEGGYTFTYEDSNNQTAKVSPDAIVMPGQLFFSQDGVVKNRFKFLGTEVRQEVNERLKETVDVTYIRIEDQKPNKKGVVYELQNFSQRDKMKFAQYDRSAVFSLEALGFSGQEFKVEENTTFALPPNGESKDYLLKSVTPEGVVVEYTDSQGQTQTVQIPKGSLPQ